MSINEPLVTLVSVVAEMPSPARAPRPESHLAGIGMLVAQPLGSKWGFDLRIRLAANDSALPALLAWAADAFPAAGRVIGWQLAERVVAPLIAATDASDPVLAEAVLTRLAPLISCGSDDLAVEHGGAGALPLGAHLAANGIPGAAMTPGEIGEAWRRGRLAEIRSMIEIQAIAVLDRWARDHGEAAAELHTALGRWLDQRRARARRS